MAPSFLSKLVKSTSSSHSRDSSQSFESVRGRSPSPAPSKTSTSSYTNPTATTATTSSTTTTANTAVPSIVISGHSPRDSDSTSRSSSPGSIGQPVVTIVPPSPRSTSRSGWSNTSSEDGSRIGYDSDRQPDASQEPTTTAPDRQRRPSFSASSKPPSITADAQTPTSARSPEPRMSNTTLPLTGSHSRTLTPSSSTGNLRELVQQHVAASPSASPSAPTLELPSFIRRKPSNKLVKVPPPISVPNHARAATSPPSRSRTSEETGDTDPPVYIPPSPVVESPTSLTSPNSLADVPGVLSASLSTATLQSSRPANPDAASIRSATTQSSLNVTNTPKKKRSWRSSTRKPSGFASAIAASGIAMAVPQLSLPGMQQAVNGTKQTPSRKTSSGPFSASSASLVSPSTKRTPSSSSKKSHSRAPSNSISTSINSENNSEIYADDRSYSGLEDSSSNNGTSSDDDSIGLDIGEDIPVTGFAVASHKRNADFHDLFRNIPEGDYLIEDYGCALQREILIQGRLYISENHVCFHSNIFGWVTDLSIPISEVTALEKKMTAFVIPNAIQITTPRSKYTFASLLARDTTFDVIFNIWRLGRPEDSASFLGSAMGSARGSLDETGGRLGMDEVRVPAIGGPDGVPKDAAILRKATQCACGRSGDHYSQTALDTVLPGTPDRIHNLIFASGFMKDFMKDDQKLLDIQISDWSPKAEGSKLLARNMSYIKPLSASIGPKQTKCEIRDETVHCDFEDYVVMLTTTRTPDVPSGGVFSVKTRTCIMWASGISTRIVVTTQVEWTGRSFIKGIIEKSAIEGQKTYHGDLDHAMRTYIQQHQAEFFPEGLDPAALPVATADIAAAAAAAAVQDPLAHPKPSEGPLEDDRKQRERERNQRGLQWAWDTFEGASQVAKQSATGALELIKETWEQSTSTTICIVIIIFLVFSNLWTLMRMGSREEVGRRKELQRTEEREKWVQGIVTALWDEMAAGKGIPVIPGGVPDSSALPSVEIPSVPPNINWREEVTSIRKTLDAVEERVRLIRDTLNSLD